MSEPATIRPHQRRLWIATVAGVLLFPVALGLLYLTLLAFGVIAPVVNIWPLIITLLAGLGASVYGFILAERAPRHSILAVVNVFAFLGHATGIGILVYLIGYPMLTAIEERFLIPDGYMGEVAIVYSIADGERENRTASGTLTYDIPSNGILLTQGKPPEDVWTRDQYFYRRSDGSLSPVESTWHTSIHDTPENRADKSVGIYMRTGIGGMSKGQCRFALTTFEVGTKAFFLSGQRGKTIMERLEIEESPCKLKSR